LSLGQYPIGRLTQRKRVRPMAKHKAESRDTKAERIYATAMAIIETDTESTRAKTECLRALRLAKEAGTKGPQKENAAPRRALCIPVSKLNARNDV
jgi:hypothetical protein